MPRATPVPGRSPHLVRPASLRDALRAAEQRLEAASPSPRMDAEVLLAHATGLARSRVLARGDEPLPAAQRDSFAALVARREAGEPVAYLTGEREFWSLTLTVTPAVLIPRPETELLVERALALIPADADWAAADLGTGSGAMALALAHERPRLRVMATDRSPEALAVARENARRLGIRNVEFRQGDWLVALAGVELDLIVSNPPYVAEGDPHLDQGDLRFEPRAALVAGRDGLAAIRRIAAEARAPLRPGGRLLLEHGYDQGDAVAGILRAAGYTEVTGWRDLAGHDRVTAGRAP